MKSKTKKEKPNHLEENIEKDVWLETQFLMSTVTTEGEYENK